MNNLSKEMQERLDKWRKNTLPVTSSEKVRGPKPTNYVARGDYGDDIRDFERKENEAWNREFQNNPMYRR